MVNSRLPRGITWRSLKTEPPKSDEREKAKVRIKEKAELKRITEEIANAFNSKSMERIRKKFNALIDVLDNICDYMNWSRPRDWQNLVTKLVAQGRTDKEQHVIDKLASKTKTKDRDSTLVNAIRSDISKIKDMIQGGDKSWNKQKVIDTIAKWERISKDKIS